MRISPFIGHLIFYFIVGIVIYFVLTIESSFLVGWFGKYCSFLLLGLIIFIYSLNFFDEIKDFVAFKYRIDYNGYKYSAEYSAEVLRPYLFFNSR